MTKKFQALIAAVLITAMVGMGMLVIGVNALLNTNTVPVQNAPGASAPQVQAAGQPAANTANVQNQQYQDQINQLQSQIQDLNNQLDQSNQQVQQLQSVLTALQQRGVIRIMPDGRILIRQGGSGDDDNNSGGGFSNPGGSSNPGTLGN